MNFVDWGLIDYSEAAQRQLALVDEVASARTGDTIVFCSHPPVVTLGRATMPEDLLGWRGQTIEVSRGGRATYHGPSQLVAYPIINLQISRTNFNARDLHGYMHALESAIVESLSNFGVKAQCGSQVSGPADNVLVGTSAAVSRTGVWVANGDKKIASIGIACRRWVTYHGLALNVEYDPKAFAGINPCGMQASTMTSLEQVLGHTVERVEVARHLRLSLEKQLSLRFIDRNCEP